MTAATMILNQIQFLHKLRDAGFSEKQAETLTEAIANDVISTLATKQEISTLATKQDVSLLKADVENLGKEFRQEMQTLEHRLYIRILGGMAVLMAIMPAFLKYFFAFLGH
jgi:hypothetical protein